MNKEENNELTCISFINDLQVEIEILKNMELVEENKIILIRKQIEEKKALVKSFEDNLKKLSKNSIEYRLYLCFLNGMTPSRAVSEVAKENYLNDIKPSSERAIWKNYYPKLKKILE